MRPDEGNVGAMYSDRTRGGSTSIRRPMPIYGDDYPTRDGTGERDFVHVVDLAFRRFVSEKINNFVFCLSSISELECDGSISRLGVRT